MASLFWRGLIILPLLFVYVNGEHFLYPKRHTGKAELAGYKGPDSLAVDGGGFYSGPLIADDDGSTAGGNAGGTTEVKVENLGKADGDNTNGNASSVESTQVAAKNGIGNGTIVEAKTTFKGSWELFVENAGVSAMHLILLPKINQALMFDATVWKISKMKLPGPPCRRVEGTNKEDCYVHSILMDVETGKIRPLR
ncbi:hypothetical protein Gorai_015739, partial [Gossypium raimondii]|nr:hypothetical protein [Gossypium raimondii]